MNKAKGIASNKATQKEFLKMNQEVRFKMQKRTESKEFGTYVGLSKQALHKIIIKHLIYGIKKIETTKIPDDNTMSTAMR